MLTGSGIQITEDVTRKAKNTRQELRKENNFISFYLFLNFVNRKFSREIKIADPSAEVQMEYDKLKVNIIFLHKNQKTINCKLLQVNGRKYTWSDAAHAVMDMMDNSVRSKETRPKWSNDVTY